MRDCLAQGNYECSQSPSGYSICEHKPLFTEFKLLEMVGALLLAIFQAMASASGIGGSEISIPLIKVFYGFSHSDTKPIDQVCIFVSCFCRYVMRFGYKHPLKDYAVEIDYTVAMILLTPVILGASIGILVYPFLPRPVVTILLLILIIGAAIKSFVKGV